MQHVRWFALGVAVGALVAALWHGAATATCGAVRAWSACAIRSLAHNKPSTPVAAASPQRPAAEPSAPCPANAPHDPCAALLAPFDAAEVETVNVDDLPRSTPDVEREAAKRPTPSP
jgi:hypothetical protein